MAYDTNMVVKVTTDGVESAQKKMEALGATVQKLTVNANGSVTASGKLTSTLNAQAGATDRVAKSTERASKSQGNYFAHIARTTIQSALINKAFLGLTNSMAKAVQQTDLIENFPATMGALGVSTEDAANSFSKLREYVMSVGGDLTLAAASVSRFVAVNKNVQASVAMYAGINNALIAGGASAESQAASLEQLTQGYSRGRFEGEEFRSMQTSMNLAMTEAAKALDLPNTQALQKALVDGEISMNKFMATLAQVSTGTGPVAQAAMAQMQGIGFAGAVMSNALTNGLTAIYQAVGRQNIIAFFSFLTSVISVLAQWVVIAINAFIWLFNVLSAFVGGPQISNMVGETAGVAQNVQAGADAAGDMGKGLDDAGKSAKKLNKQLAGFDKMNVLQDKDSGGGGKDAGGGAGGSPAAFDPGSAAALDGIFDGISGSLKEASKWAKIFAGILAGLAANALIKKIFGVSPLKLFAKALGTYVLAPLGRLALQGGAIAGKFGLSLARGLLGLGSGGSGVMGSAAALGAKIGLAIRGGISTGITTIGSVLSKIPSILGNALSKVPALLSRLAGGWVGVLGRALLTGLAAIGSAIVGVIGAVAAALGVPFAVAAAIVAAVVAAIVAIVWVIWTNWEVIWGFISGVAIGFWNWLVGAWTALIGILSGPFQIMWQIVSSIFILIVALVAITLETIYNILVGIGTWVYDNVITPVWKFFVWLWNTIVEGVKAMWNGMIAVLVTIGTWIYENVITPIVDFFVGLWNGIVDLAKQWWEGLMEIFIPIATWISVNIITPITNFFRGLWDGIKNMVSEFITAFKNFFTPIATWIKTNVIDRIAGFFTGLWDGVLSGVKGIISGVKSVMSTIAGLVKAPINGVIDLINGVIDGINKIKVPDWVPGLGGESPNFPKIPRLAKGGIVSRSTLIEAGEAGEEAIVPLENNTGAIEKIAALLNSAGGNGQPVQLVVQIGEEQIANKVIDLINEKTQMSGRNAIYV